VLSCIYFTTIFGEIKMFIDRKTPKLGSTEAAPVWDGTVADLKTSPLPICVTTLNLVVRHQRMYPEIEWNPQNWRALGHHPLAVGCG